MKIRLEEEQILEAVKEWSLKKVHLSGENTLELGVEILPLQSEDPEQACARGYATKIYAIIRRPTTIEEADKALSEP